MSKDFMLLPKPKKGKKRRKQKEPDESKVSIMQPKEDRRCYLCMLLNHDYTYKDSMQEHHAVFGNDRHFAETRGLKVNL